MAAGFGYSSDTPEGCWDELVRDICPRLVGQRIDTLAGATVLVHAMPGSNFAKSGVETALWDLWGKAIGKPLAALLGGVRARVESGLAVGLYPTTEELLDRVARHMADGYRRLKIKIKPGADVRLVAAVRDRFGDIPLFVDANAAYTASDIPIFRELDRFRLMMFEQPFATDDWDGLAQLQRAVETPVCVDESAKSPAAAAQLIRGGCCKIVNIKIQRVGGLGPAREIHDLCQQAGIPCWVGTMPELGVGQAQGLHLAALSNCTLATDIEPSLRWFVDDYTEPLIDMDKQGMIEVPSGPGLGYEVSLTKVAKYRVREASVDG
jgi:O-succinylbenzoate synthase